MFKHILLPTDGSARSEHAIDAGIAFAKAVRARVTGITASDDLVPPYDEWVISARATEQLEEAAAHAAKGFLAAIEQRAAAAQVPYDGVYVPNREPSRAILETADQRGCDLIFMSSHGRRGLGALLLGSVTQKVLISTGVPVLVYRD